MGKEATTLREAMVAEALGELGDLLSRLEKVNETLPDATEKAISKIKTAMELASGNLTASGDKIIREFDEKIKHSLESIRQASKDTQSAASVVDRSAHRFAIFSAVIGFTSGILGGVLAALAFSNYFFR